MRWWAVFLRGMAMGAADLVPGVSGGTIAFVTGIYERLIQAIRAVDYSWLKKLLAGQWRDCWNRADGAFLALLLAGIVCSIFSLAGLISDMLVEQPVLTWAFFFGLIVASSIFVMRQIGEWVVATRALLLLGVLLAVLIGLARPVSVDVTQAYLFMCGALAICAMILPGISGSFILLLLGGYAAVLQAVHQLDWRMLSVFVSGNLVGLLVFTHVLGWLLERYHDRVLALLTGFLVGSLFLIWPWKEVVSFYTDSSGDLQPLRQINVGPARFAEVTGQDPQLLAAVLIMCAAIVLALGLEKLSESDASAGN